MSTPAKVSHRVFDPAYTTFPHDEKRPLPETTHSSGRMGSSLARLFECLVDEWTIVEESKELDARGEKRVFALIRKQTASQNGGDGNTSSSSSRDRYSYESKYPADAEGEGMSSNARVWRVYLDEAAHFDTDMVENIRDTVDIILVFAGLFSAVVSTLVGQASTALQPDFAHITASLISELVAVQRAIAAGAVIGAVPPSLINLDSPFAPSSADRWVNGLWFISLAFSLATALLSVLVKQWIQAYNSPSFGTPHFQSRVRHFRYIGMQEWHVPLITGTLPILLHLALALFFIGLVVQLFTLDHVIGGFLTVIGILAYTAYLGTNLLPVWYPQCPYKTPLSRYAYVILDAFGPTFTKPYRQMHRFSRSAMARVVPPCELLFLQCRRHFHQITTGWSVLADLYLTRVDVSEENTERPQPHPKTLHLMEHGAVQANGESVDARMLGWLCNVSANPSVRAVVVAAVSDLEIGFSALETLRTNVLPHTCAALGACMKYGEIMPGREATVDVCLRAHMQLGPGKITHAKRPAHGSTQPLDCSCYVYVNQDTFGETRMKALGMLGQAGSIAGVYGVDSQVSPDARHLRQLRPPASSKRAWILLLRGALLVEMDAKHPARRRLSFSIERDQATLAFWLTQAPINHLTTMDPDHYSVLEGVLLAAYMCQWTRPAGTALVHPPLLHAALHDVEHLEIKKAIEEFQHHPGKSKLHDLITYYRAHLRIHILVQYTQTRDKQENIWLSLSNRLASTDEWSPSIFQYIFSFYPPVVTLPDQHPLLDQLRYLVPTPTSVRALLQAWSHDPATLSRVLKMITNISRFLLQTVSHEEIINVVKSHDLMEAFYIVTEHQASLSRRGANRLADSIAMYWIGSALKQSFSSSLKPMDHEPYVRSHLVGLAVRALAEWADAHRQAEERTVNVDSFPRPVLWCLGDLAQFMARNLDDVEYRRAWTEVIEVLPNSLLREQHRDSIGPFVDKLHDYLDRIWSTETEHRKRGVESAIPSGHADEGLLTDSLWSKMRSGVVSLMRLRKQLGSPSPHKSESEEPNGELTNEATGRPTSACIEEV